jgi:2-C-methyl-D-erythritol 2,4-cyclodiphosphate synthase
MRVGLGYDVHKLVSERKLILGGVEINYEKGLLGHSDADVLVHAIMDSLLGAAALGDIGVHFPDSDPKYKGISSLQLLEKVSKIIDKEGFEVGNIDATIVAQKPKMSPYIKTMRENISSSLNIPVDKINIKATTEEGLGFTGSCDGISAQSICCIKIKEIEK